MVFVGTERLLGPYGFWASPPLLNREPWLRFKGNASQEERLSQAAKTSLGMYDRDQVRPVQRHGQLAAFRAQRRAKHRRNGGSDEFSPTAWGREFSSRVSSSLMVFAGLQG